MRNRAFAFSFLFIACAAQGQVYKCSGADGKVAYQSEPCDGGKALGATPQKASPPAGSSGAQMNASLLKASECSNLSRAIESLAQYSSSYRTVQDNDKVAAFRRDCVPLGYQFPDSRASAEHNKALMEEVLRKYTEQFQRPGSAPPSPESTQASETPPKFGRCMDLSRAIEYMVKDTSTYKTNDGAAKIVEFRRDCQPIGYQFPDTRANAEHNRALFNDLLRQSAERSRR